MNAGAITCRQLVQFYLNRMDAFDSAGPKLNSIRARNPKALDIAAALDKLPASAKTGPLFCIPVALKDNIDTADMPTTGGSVALQNTFPLEDAFLTKQLKAAGAIIIAKANLTEFANFLTNGMPAGYSSLGGYVLDPYDPRPVPKGLPNSDGRQALSPGGSSSGPGVVAAANLAAVTVGSETSGSILSPASSNSDVGIKPTVGLISRSGVIPISASQDTAGPITRTVTDAAILLGAMTGVDGHDSVTVSSQGKALKDYTPFLKTDALKGARIGIARQFWTNANPEQKALAERAFEVMRSLGAELVDINFASLTELNAFTSSVLNYEFKRDLNAYLATRGPSTPIKMMSDVIVYNSAHPDVAIKYGQMLALQSEALDLYAAEPQYVADRANDLKLAKVQGIDATMDANNISAWVFPANFGAGIAAKAGYPSITVPGGYLSNNTPYGITFSGKAYSEATLIGLAYSFEQATRYRQPPGSALRILPHSKTMRPDPLATIAPGQIITITGSGLGPATPVTQSIKSNNQVDTLAGGTRVLFDGIPAPIMSAQANRIVAIAPYALAGKQNAQMYVEANGQRSANLTVPVTDASPSIVGSILNEDGSRNAPANPAKKGSLITLSITGEGLLNTLPIDGRLPTAPLQTPLLPLVVTLNNNKIAMRFANAAAGSPGLMQINAQLDPDQSSGTLQLRVQVGTKLSPPLDLYVQ